MNPSHFPSFCLAALAPVIAGSGLLVAQDQGWNPDTKFLPLAPAEAMKTIEVPKDYRLECMASEPMVKEPVSFAFDGNGAMYVCEWLTYMQDEFGTRQLDPVSRVIKLTDTDGDGVMDKRTGLYRQLPPAPHRAPAARSRARDLHPIQACVVVL